LEYGFVYLWRDKKKNRYYVGCHWGKEDDRYICSSTNMKHAYKRRPNDFKRRVISRIYTNRQDLFEEEYRWLQMIKPEELRKRYYNLHNKRCGHWANVEYDRKTIGQRAAQTRKQKYPNWGHWTKDRTVSETTRRKISDANRKRLRTPCSEETKQKISESLQGRKFSEVHKRNMSISHIGNVPWNKGITWKKKCKQNV